MKTTDMLWAQNLGVLWSSIMVVKNASHQIKKTNKQTKKQKDKELLRVGWHLSRWWDWCMPIKYDIVALVI